MDTSDDKLVVIREWPLATRAYLAQSILDDAGIFSAIHNELMSGYGNYGASRLIQVQLVVRESDVALANELLAEMPDGGVSLDDVHLEEHVRNGKIVKFIRIFIPIVLIVAFALLGGAGIVIAFAILLFLAKRSLFKRSK